MEPQTIITRQTQRGAFTVEVYGFPPSDALVSFYCFYCPHFNLILIIGHLFFQTLEPQSRITMQTQGEAVALEVDGLPPSTTLVSFSCFCV